MRRNVRPLILFDHLKGGQLGLAVLRLVGQVNFKATYSLCQ